MTDIILSERLKPNQTWSWVVEKGLSLRVTDVSGDGNLSMLVFNNDNVLEKYNMPDTLKAQHTAHLTKGHCIYSDMGRVLFSITEDSVGWHDTICGVLNNAQTEKKYGPSSYQELRNDYHRSGRQNLLVEMGKNGLNKKDFGPCLNLFSKVWVDEKGGMNFSEHNSKAGSQIILKAEMNCLMVVSNTPHPLNPSQKWEAGEIILEIFKSENELDSEICRTHCPENERGFLNNQRYFSTKVQL